MCYWTWYRQNVANHSLSPQRIHWCICRYSRYIHGLYVNVSCAEEESNAVVKVDGVEYAITLLDTSGDSQYENFLKKVFHFFYFRSCLHQWLTMVMIVVCQSRRVHRVLFRLQLGFVWRSTEAISTRNRKRKEGAVTREHTDCTGRLEMYVIDPRINMLGVLNS